MPVGRHGRSVPSTVVTTWRRGLLWAAAVSTLAACSSSVESVGVAPAEPSGSSPSTADGAPSATHAPPPSTTVAVTTTTAPATTTTTSTTSTTTTTTEPPLDVHDPDCVVRVRPGEALGEIASRFDDDILTVAAIQAENALDGEILHPGQLLDVCVDNGLDDITGEQRAEPNAAVVAANVERQQTKLNELFAGLGIRELLVDGISGPVTRQRLCAFRLAFGLPVGRHDMERGSEEEQILMQADSLPIPYTSAILSEKWILIDQTCQIMFVGEGAERLVFVFPTSTGMPGYRTRPQDRTPAYRYNPASHNDGWHNSLTFPAADDNPLNGNMYRPIYFDRGQAIHGAMNVPTSPQSKGCARLRVEHQDMLIEWLGLGTERRIEGRDRIGVTVNVQGEY